MKQSENLPSGTPLVGHVKNGVIIVEGNAAFVEGQAVRIEPLPRETTLPTAEACEEKLNRMESHFAQSDEEDSKITDEEADRLRVALQQNPRLSFRIPKLDSSGYRFGCICGK